jgi:hypothetical protein
MRSGASPDPIAPRSAISAAAGSRRSIASAIANADIRPCPATTASTSSVVMTRPASVAWQTVATCDAITVAS